MFTFEKKKEILQPVLSSEIIVMDPASWLLPCRISLFLPCAFREIYFVSLVLYVSTSEMVWN